MCFWKLFGFFFDISTHCYCTQHKRVVNRSLRNANIIFRVERRIYRF